MGVGEETNYLRGIMNHGIGYTSGGYESAQGLAILEGYFHPLAEGTMVKFEVIGGRLPRRS